MTSGYIITNFLRTLGEEVEVMFPQRSDGYGLNMLYCRKIVEQDSDKNSVVITVDNGITKVKEIKYLKENDVTVIITDHHEPLEVLPDCVMCDPFLDENSAGHHLCGAGVIWKVICIIEDILRKQEFKFPVGHIVPFHYLSYVAIGTIGDVMPFTKENLAIMRIGLSLLDKSEVHVLDVLFKNGLFGSHRVNVKNIIFGLNSMMNACSRMGQIWRACKLFFMEDYSEDEIYAYGQEMKHLNEKRKTENKKAVEYVLSNYTPKADDKIIVADIGDFTAGLSGLVATNLVQQFNVPVVIYKKIMDGKLAAGSVRSVEGLNILEYLEEEKLKGNVESYGGHSMSCGVRFRSDKISAFISDMNILLKDFKFEEQKEFTIDIDAVVKCKDINQELKKEIDQLPYNDTTFNIPTFCLKNVNVTATKPSKDHIQYLFSDDTGTLETIEWHGYPRYKELGSPKKVDVVFTVEDLGISCYGKCSDDLNLKILDIKKVA